MSPGVHRPSRREARILEMKMDRGRDCTRHGFTMVAILPGRTLDPTSRSTLVQERPEKGGWIIPPAGRKGKEAA